MPHFWAASSLLFVGLGVVLISGAYGVPSGVSWNATEYTCLDGQWIESCKFSSGSLFSGSRYNHSVTRQPCVDGTSCRPDAFSSEIRCQVGLEHDDQYEECLIPLCAELQLCDSTLEALDSVPVFNRVATVSSPKQLLAALRNHSVIEIVLTSDIEASDSDLHGIPIFIRPRRELVVNKQGNAMLYIKHEGALPAFFVLSGSTMIMHRTAFAGNPFDLSTFEFERDGRLTVADTELVFDACEKVSAYSQRLFAMQTTGGSGLALTGNAQDGNLRLHVTTTDWMLMQVYGVGYRPDPLNQLSGALRFVNVTVHCDGSNTPKLQGFVDHSERSSPPIPAGPESAKSDFSDLNLLLPVAAVSVVLALLIVVFAAYRCGGKWRNPSEPCVEVNNLAYESWIQRKDDPIDTKDVPSTAQMCQTISSVIEKVNQMAMEKTSTRIRGVSDFEMVGSMVRTHLDRDSAFTPKCVKDSDSECEDEFMSNMEQVPEPNVQASKALRAGSVINGYVYVRQLGSGSHGEVCLVQEQATGEHFTMKIPTASDVQPVVQEAYLLAMLDHPNIVGHKETLVSNGQLIVVTEWCNCGDLSSIMKRSNHIPFSEQFIRSMLFQLAFGIAHMHSRGVAHRDIKPANIFITDRGVVKLGDLGSGRVLLDTSDTFTGTPLFMAPEIFAGEAYTKECDVYSLGLVVFLLCTGNAAYSSATSLHDLQDLKIEGMDLSDLRGKYSDQLVDAMDMMMLPEVCRPTARQILSWDWLRQLSKCDPDSKSSPQGLTLVIRSEVSSRLNGKS